MKKLKIFGIIIVLLAVLITAISIKNAALPIYVEGRNSEGIQTLSLDGDLYVRCNLIWSIVEKDKVIAKGQNKYDSKIDLLLFPNKIYSAKDDAENRFLWYVPFISEFGGELYVESDFELPQLHEMKPNKIFVGSFFSLKSIYVEVYAYSESVEIIDNFIDIVSENKAFEYEYSEEELKLLENAYEVMPYFSIMTEQVPGGAYSVYITKENERYYIYSDENDIKFDITYILLKILTEGTIVEE